MHSIFDIMDKYSTAGLCVNPFVLVGTQCVHIILATYGWHEARTQCGLVGGDLFVVDDCDQYHKVSHYLAEQGNRLKSSILSFKIKHCISNLDGACTVKFN